MLRNLYIRNFALFDEIEVEFGPHLNIITGETGAGKSLIIDAINAILGEKIDPQPFGDGNKKAIVEGVFLLPKQVKTENLLDREDLEHSSDEVILRREVHPSGHSRSFLNDSPVTMKDLSRIADALVDLHGQHEHQSLLKSDNHLYFLDHFGGLEELRMSVEQKYKQVKSLTRKLDRLKKEERAMQERKDYLQFQLQEIKRVNPGPEEDQKLKHDQIILQNSEKLSRITEIANSILYADESSIYSQLGKVIDQLEEIVATDRTFAQISDECSSIQIQIEEIARRLRSYNQNIDFDQKRLDEIYERLSLLNRLKDKHGGSLKKVLQYRDEILSKLSEANTLSQKIEELENKLAKAKADFSKQAIELSRKRKELSPKLEERVIAVLGNLGMKKVRFKVRISSRPGEEGIVEIDGQKFQADGRGIDVVEFYLSANPGEELKPLVKVASGGEISRIMLALKSILAGKDQIPTLIFDEIDRGVSGHIAHRVGNRLGDLADYHQVICITHLPQIACQGASHFVVKKDTHLKETEITVNLLDHEDRISEIAKLLGGEKVTETSLKSALELLKQAA